MDESQYWTLELDDAGEGTASLSGDWELENLPAISERLEASPPVGVSGLVLDGSELERLDTAGALFAYQFAETLGVPTSDVRFRAFRPKHLAIAELVRRYLSAAQSSGEPAQLSLLQRVGARAVRSAMYLVELVSFLGAAVAALGRTLLRPRSFRWREFVVQLQRVAVDAVPITSLVMLLIGFVVAYLVAAEIERYGASIYIVDGVSIAICRELSPIIVAIIVAGRSGSAFTAQIGTIKLNDELDAIRTLGLSPMAVLVLPRWIALMVALPLLVVLGDVVGIVGGWIIAGEYLGITATTFFDRLQSVLGARQVVIGVCKAPVFAAFIGLIGCQMGFSVERNARSIGLHTTSTVVQGIVAVILLDAGFAILFQNLGW